MIPTAYHYQDFFLSKTKSYFLIPVFFVILIVILGIVNYCRVPKPEPVGYRYTEVVRKQDLRKKMDGFACFQCQQVSFSMLQEGFYLFIE